MAPVTCTAVFQVKRDTDEPESSIISVLMPPTLPKIPDACNLMVATTIVSLGLIGTRDACGPWQTSLGRSLPAILCIVTWTIENYNIVD